MMWRSQLQAFADHSGNIPVDAAPLAAQVISREA